jgi:glutathionylspermidine amidase/synthetase
MVFEPLWTLIPSNKAILPVLWQLFPNHPNLLNSSFTLTEELTAQGYVSKPIVGRCGSNIALFDENAKALVSTPGRFADQEKIYQQLFALPHIDELYVQICSFTAAGVYSGSGTRVDPSMVVSQDSDCLPLRFIDDRLFIAPLKTRSS